MRAIAILLLLAAAGGGGWWWWTHHQAATQTPDENPFTTSPNTVPAATLPPEAVKAKAEADALWSKAGGGDPATMAEAPHIARLYSQVLLAMYGLVGTHDMAQQLIDQRLAPLGNALFFTKARWTQDPTGLMDVHVVAPSENPDAIARSYGMSRELLNRLRGKDVNDANLRVGDTLKIVKVKDAGGYEIRVGLADYTLDLFIGGVFAKRYVITHGAAASPTPVGRAHLTDRVWHPAWTKPDTKQVLPYGDPDNILGPIWLPCDAKELGTAGIGIHGYTGADGKMRAQLSNGCIRMQNQDAEELFQLISHPQRAPTLVVIQR